MTFYLTVARWMFIVGVALTWASFAASVMGHEWAWRRLGLALAVQAVTLLAVSVFDKSGAMRWVFGP